ncbi:S-layer homology domain-containing protein [Peptoanaerobacter stomatis]
MSGDTRGDSEKEIIAFSSLPDGVREQEIRQGEDLSAVTFPDTLQILVEETALVDKNSMSKDKVLPKATQSELPLVETKEEEAENSVKADVEETAEPAKDNTSAEESVEAEKSDTSAVEPAKNSDENEVIKETTLKDVTLQNVRWEIDEENSSKSVFSSENAGDSFIFEPVIPEEYSIAADVELPKIHVAIKNKETAKTAFEASAVVDGVKISVKANDGVFKDAKTLKVRKVSNLEEEKVKEAVEDKREGDRKVAVSYTFDISVLDHEGNEVQPDTTKGEVSVSFQMEEAKNQNLSADIYHVDEASQAEKLETEVEGEEVSAKTDGFSFYTVEFTYGNMQYVLLGDSTINLSEILAKVGLSGEVTAVSVSNSALFSAEKTADNKWLITAHQAFDTKEWMKVTINGVVHEIAVTDSQHPLTVTGGTEGVDYKWEDYAYYLNGDTVVKEPVGKKYMLHILTSKAMVIEGDATQFKDADGTPDGKGGAIVIPEGVEANLTLRNTKIFPMKLIPPMNVMKDAECNLTLEGENTLTPRIIHITAGQGAKFTVPAIWVPEGAKLTVSEASTGVLTASSAYENAVIGGWKEHHSGDITIDGGILKLENYGALESSTYVSGPCIGGYNNCGNITINGGKIEATCVQSAPIGMSFNKVPYLDAEGNVIVNGGTIVTRHQNYFGPISYYADGIGDTQHKTAVNVKINGGNVDTDFDRTRPRNGYAYVYRAKITLLGAGEGQTVTSYTMFNGETVYLQDTKTLPNGELYLWLSPAQNQIITSVHCGGQDYTGVVKAVDNDNDAQAVFRIGTTGTGTLTANMKAEHVQGGKLSQTTGLSAGDTVYLSFSGVESGYLFKGMCLYKGTTLPPAPREVSSDFTKITDKLYSFTMPAENVTVYLNAPKIRTVSAGEQTHIESVSFNPTANLTVGDTVKLSYVTEAGWKVSGMALRKATDPVTNPQDISTAFTKITDNNYQFIMSDYDVCVDFKCKEVAPSGAEAGDFIISDATCTYRFDESRHELELSGAGKATISMKSGVSSTTDCIKIKENSRITLTIKDLTVSAPQQGVSGLTFSNNIGDCRLILEGRNTFTSDKGNTPAVRKQTFGKLTISGKGKLIAIATGANSNGIGSGDCGNLYIEGGTIYAKASHDNMAIGHAKNGSDFVVYYTGGTVEGICENAQLYGGLTGKDAKVTITGGSIHSMNHGFSSLSVHDHPTNGSAKVYCSTITLGEGATLAKQAYVTALTGAGSYGINHMHTDDEGKLYLWLPENTTVTKVETDQGIYVGSVTTNTANYFGTAHAVFTLAEKQEGSGSVAIEGWTYGESAKAPVPTSTTNGTANVSYTYFTDEACTIKTTTENSGAESTGGVPKNAGNYWVQATFAETPRYKAVTAKAGFAIKKATVSFTAPTPKTGLAYTGEAQALITAGIVDSAIGKMQYSLSETGTYSETIPKKENAGSYSVYYKVAGTNANYDYTNAKGNVNVSIAKVSITPTVAITGWTYKASPNAPTVTGNKGNGAVTYEYFTDENCTTKTTAANSLSNSEGGVPKNAGKYRVKATIAETENYNGATAKAGFEIKKANQTALSIKSVTDKKYGDADFTLETTGGSGNGAVSYSVPMGNGILEITGDTAKIVGVGTVTVTAVKAGGNNYNETSATLDITIAKGDEPAIAFPTASELTYGQALSESTLTGGSTQYGTFAWKDGSTIPTIDNTGYDVVFKPNATALKNYNIEEKTRTIEVKVKKGNQTGFAITAIPQKTYGDSEFKLTTTGGSGNGAVSYSVSANNGVLFIAGDTAKIIGAGTVEITAVKAADANYNEASSSISITIAKKKLIVRADDKMIARNDPMPTFTSTAEGLVNGDTLINPTFTTTAANTGTNGKYEIIVNGGTVKNTAEAEVTGNYEITYQKGELTIVEKLYEAEVINGSGSGRYLDGQTVHIKALDKSGYTFSGWTSPDGVVFAKPLEKETDFVMPAKDVKVTATYRSNSSGSSYGYDSSDPKDDDSSISIKTEKAPDLPTIAEITVKAKKGEDKTATAKLSEKTTEKAIKKAKEEAKKKGKEANGIALEINMTMPKGTDKVQMHLSESTLEKMVSGEVKHLTVNGSFAKVVFDKNAMFEIQKQSSGNVTVNVIPVKKLSKAAEKLIGKRPVYDISLRSGNGKKITAFGNGTATVFLSYKAEKKEAIGGLYAVYVDEKEKASKIEDSAYDVNSSSVIFKTNHLSVYGVGYTAPSERFDDIKNHWAKDFIDYVAGRGLITGSTKTTFSPDENMTRGMLVATLGRLAGVNGKNYDTNSFSDVQKDSPYRPYIEWAYSKGIVYGIGDGTFAPDKSITREEMAVIFERYAKATGYHIPVNRQANIYADKENIGSEYKEAVTAMQQSGIMMGVEGNRFNPKGTATRAEVSAMLGRYIKLTITPETAQGFAIDDAGKYHCYKDGKAMTGKQTLNGMVYFFDESGVLQTGWVKDGNRWRYYDGAKAHKGWLHLKTDGEEKIYYLNKEGLLESGKWVKIDGKWYYFYPDGTLAVNTKIDGYEIDSKGVRKEK